MNLILWVEGIYKEQTGLSPMIKISVPSRANLGSLPQWEGLRPTMAKTKLETYHEREKT